MSAIEGVPVETTYMYRSSRVVDLLVKLGAKRDSIDLYLAGDLYYIFYLPFPSLVDNPSNELDKRLAILNQVLSNSKTWKIKSYTVADTQLSMVAATLVLYYIIHELKSNQPRKGQGVDEFDLQRAEKGNAVSRAIGRALERVRNAAAAKAILEKLGAGSSSSLLFEDTLDIMLDLSKHTDITEIERILSGIRFSLISSPSSGQAPRGWVEGLEIGGDIERIHPSRLALPDDIFLVELANSRLLLYQKKTYMDYGDVYVLLDKSGSMSGDKINWARAVALALLAKARAGRRRFRLRFFDSIVYELIEVRKRAKTRYLAEALRKIATVKASGGTNITGALARAVEDSDKGRGRVDIVLITDGEDKLSLHIVRSILARPSVRLHTVMIRGENKTLEEVSDTYMVAEKLDEGEGLKVVKKAFSRA